MSCNFQKFFYDVPDVEVDVVDRQHCRLTICIELVELTAHMDGRADKSDDKIQITILILSLEIAHS